MAGPLLSAADRHTVLGALPAAAWVRAGVPAGVPLSADGRRSVAQVLYEAGFRAEAIKIRAGVPLRSLPPHERAEFSRRVGAELS